MGQQCNRDIVNFKDKILTLHTKTYFTLVGLRTQGSRAVSKSAWLRGRGCPLTELCALPGTASVRMEACHLGRCPLAGDAVL